MSADDEDKKRPKRDPIEVWKALHEQAAHDELDEIIAMSDDELDAMIAAEGGDPRAIRERSVAFVRELMERRRALDWQRENVAKLEALRDTDAARPKPSLSRAELLAAIERARRHPRFASGVATQFHKKTLDACTDEELAALLEELELLARLADERDDE